eukprot:5787612-Amphidinium_carterae.1
MQDDLDRLVHNLPEGIREDNEYLVRGEFRVTSKQEVIRGPPILQCVRHYVPLDAEYSRLKNDMSDAVMVPEGTWHSYTLMWENEMSI